MPGVCPRCNRDVYFAEERLALGKVWHTFCFSCRKCRKLLDSCSVATHRGELFCKNCYASLFPTATLTFSLPADASISPKAELIPASVSTRTAIEICESDLVCRCCTHSIESDVIFENSSPRKEPYKITRLCGGGVDEQPRASAKQRLRRTATTAETQDPTADSCNNKVYNSETIDDEICRWPVQPEQQERAKGENLEQTESNPYVEQQQRDRSQNAGQWPIKNSDGGTNSLRNRLSTGEYRATRVTLSTRESPTSRESRSIIVSPDTPSRRKCSCRRRVSFSDAVVDHGSRTMIVQNDSTSSPRDNNGERETFYDIWRQADDSAERSDDETTTRLGDRNSENRVSSRIYDKEPDTPERDETITNDGRMRGGKSDVCSADRVAASTRVDEDDTTSNEDRKDPIDSVDDRGDEYRMRGGCGGCCAAVSRENVRRSLQDARSCRCRSRCHCNSGGLAERNESCATAESSRCDGGVEATCTAIAAACRDTLPSCRCRCRYVGQGCRRAAFCKKATRCGEVSARTTGARGCSSGGGCCGGGGGCCCCCCCCEQPGQIYAPSSRNVCGSAPAWPSLNCASSSSCGGCSASGYGRCRSTIASGCCTNNKGKRDTDAVCCRLKSPAGCVCLGGGLDCRRCGRKVYQAEMQIASGVPYHNICFSCFCCRKPLEPLTYQENCGEIYCKQCYVRNFGPQGYGYGVGAGVLQTPM